MINYFVQGIAVTSDMSRSVTTVNSEIFASIFSRNFAGAKFRENKTIANGKITLFVTDVVKSSPSRNF